jgi:hypothetical protein
VDSRKYGAYCRRRYRCDNGHRFTTIEIPVPNTGQGVNSYDNLIAGLAHGERLRETAHKLRELAKEINGE